MSDIEDLDDVPENAVLMILSADEDTGKLSVRIGHTVEDHADPNMVEFLEDLCNGLRIQIDLGMDTFLGVGRLARTLRDTLDTENSVNFEPDEELLRLIEEGSASNVVQFKKGIH